MRALLFLATVALLSAQPAGKSHADFRAEAQAAYQRKDYSAALAATAEALKLRPDSPRYLHNLAALSALTGDEPGAIAYLERLGALGVTSGSFGLHWLSASSALVLAIRRSAPCCKARKSKVWPEC